MLEDLSISNTNCYVISKDDEETSNGNEETFVALRK